MGELVLCIARDVRILFFPALKGQRGLSCVRAFRVCSSVYCLGAFTFAGDSKEIRSGCEIVSPALVPGFLCAVVGFV